MSYSLGPRHIFALVTILVASAANAQDTRKISEPVFPPSCTMIPAPLLAGPWGKLKSQDDRDALSAAETATIQSALNGCAAGQAVELSLAANGAGDAFLINPLQVPAGVSLIVDEA